MREIMSGTRSARGLASLARTCVVGNEGRGTHRSLALRTKSPLIANEPEWEFAKGLTAILQPDSEEFGCRTRKNTRELARSQRVSRIRAW